MTLKQSLHTNMQMLVLHDKNDKIIYRTCAIITRDFYIFTPFLKTISFEETTLATLCRSNLIGLAIQAKINDTTDAS